MRIRLPFHIPARAAQNLRHRPLLLALLFALLVNSYIVVVVLCLFPLHAKQYGQPLFGYLDGLSSILQLPGLMLGGLAGLKIGRHASLQTWIGALGFNAIFWFAIAYAVIKIRGWRAVGARQLKSVSTSPRLQSEPAAPMSRRSFLGSSARVAVCAGAAVGGWSFLAEPRWFEISRQTFRLRGLPVALDGLRLVQLSDIHHGPWLSIGYVREIIDSTNELRPDVIALTGDYIHSSQAYINPVVDQLARLRPAVGIVSVLGNHDWWEGAHVVRAAFAQHGLRLIDNTRVFLTPDRRIVPYAKEGLCFAAVGDYWCDRQDYAGALGRLPEMMPRVLLSHNPDVAEDREFVDSKLRVDLMLSGHTHGGQVRLPVLGPPIVPSRYGAKYAGGLVRGPVCPVFVSRGIGMSGLPIRIGSRPEIALIELRSA